MLSEYMPANNANDRRVIPIHAPIPGVDMSYVAVLRARAYSNYLAARDQARQAYTNCDPDGVEHFSAEASAYMEAMQNCSAFIADVMRIRSN